MLTVPHARFERKRMKSWLARGSSGRLVPRTVFRINGTCSVDLESTSSTSQLFLYCVTPWLLIGSVWLVKLTNLFYFL